MKRTLTNCSLVKKIGKPVQYDGKCEGFAGPDGDEPCRQCQSCELHYINAEEALNTSRNIAIQTKIERVEK